MTIQGLMDRLQRGFKNKLNGILNYLDKGTELRIWNKQAPRKRKKKKLRKSSQHFRKNSAAAHIEKSQIIDSPGVEDYEEEREFYSKKRRIPWLRNAKRILAGGLLFVNFLFSQFLLAATNQAELIFFVFLGNSFIILDYLWKTRRREG